MPRGRAIGSGKADTTPRKRVSNNPNGRPNDPTVAELEASIDEYFAHCDETGRFPTESGMFLYLGFFGKRLDDYLKKPKYQTTWQKAKLRRMDWLENQMVTSTKNSQGCMNALKQEKNGGYIDRSSANVNSGKAKELKINLTGVGGKEAAG